MIINQLITCEKIIDRKRRPEYKEENRHYRMNIELRCTESDVKMIMFIRQLKDFPEDFSGGLRLIGPNEINEHDIVLVRFQGPHGGQSLDKSMVNLHNSYHIHEYTLEDASCHRKKASYKGPAMFNSIEEAIVQFLDYCNIKDPNGIFNNEKTECEQYKLEIECSY